VELRNKEGEKTTAILSQFNENNVRDGNIL
jgi:hypothetical protein